ncbi:hypothetical protein [Cupriavidus numazuensis]|nr:hypothetical protein [Cupriavidus numazuensis]
MTERSDTKKQTNLRGDDDKLHRMYTFGERLRWAMARMEPPMSGRALAHRIGIRPQSIHYLLDPARNAQGSRHTSAIARVLGVSGDWLASGKGRPYEKGERQADPQEVVASCLASAKQLVADLERLIRLLEGKG